MSVIAIGASASLGEPDADGSLIVEVRPWWSSKTVERDGPTSLNQMLPPITVTAQGLDGPWTPRRAETVKVDIDRQVLANETWDQIVPDEDERARLWRGIAWT